MTDNQKRLVPELLQNFIMSAQMEGFVVTESIQSMCLSVLNGEHTLEECLHQISLSYDGE